MTRIIYTLITDYETTVALQLHEFITRACLSRALYVQSNVTLLSRIIHTRYRAFRG